MQNFTEIAHCVHDLRHFVQNRPLLLTLEANLIQSGWNMKNGTDLKAIDHMTMGSGGGPWDECTDR